ncbi:deaminase [Parathalassolituus penaei]|uniref:Deaminase n=1 Tax=Parathalassolituus penaei TaxID=2997323 RepID=A0A9X3IRK9_9GAMM|nr:deaminase [Parathalassolituus penaei]MCY0965332.1 deaminase [Parathalassolituus penaei]
MYSYESEGHDFRCVHKGRKCYNDFYKNRLGEEIKDLLIKRNIDSDFAGKLVADIFSETKAGDLIEYSRAIHAEMDAITTLARLQSSNTKGKTIYCTTYPCHNCARHIVAAGIIRVVYIEPYEKSLALKLHDDSITDSSEHGKVVFVPYEGVSPSKYNSFFKIHEPRKRSDGSANLIDISQSKQIDPQFLDSYHAYEDKITQSLEQDDQDSSSNNQ